MSTDSRVLGFYIMSLGNTLGVQIEFLNRLKQRLGLRQVFLESQCDFIIAFLCVVSRAGTDIEAALPKIPTEKPVLLVVLHHTFDKHYIAPESKWHVNRHDILAVDVLFHEEEGLLRSLHNDKALKLSSDYLISLGASQNVAPETVHTRRNAWKWILGIFVVVVALTLIITLIVEIYENKMKL